MKTRIMKKVANSIYEKILNGNFAEASTRLNKISPNKQRKILTLFNTKSFENLGVDQGANLIVNFAGYKGFRKGMQQVGGSEGIAQEICESLNLQLRRTIEKASSQVTKELPQSPLGWIELILKDTWAKTKKLVKEPISRAKNYVENKFKLQKSHVKQIKPKSIPDNLKGILENLSGKSGQEFAEAAYKNMVKHMNLGTAAPKSIVIKGSDGLMNVTGGYDPVTNTIKYSKGFLEKLSQEQQINLISHELKHCEQFTNMIRTEGIGVEKYARAIAENNVRNAIKESSLNNIMFRMQYQEALANGKGEEFIQNAIVKSTEKIIPELETNFAEVLKMPKIKADSAEGIRAYKHLEAQRNYEGLDFLGMAGENYKNNPLEVEAYAFGDEVGKSYKDFMS